MKRALAYVLAATLSLCAGCAPIAAPPTPTPVPTESIVPSPTTATSPAVEKTVRRWFGPGWAEKSPYRDLGEMTYLYQTDSLSIIIDYPYVTGALEDSEINRLLKDEALEHWGTDEAKQLEDGTPVDGSVDGDWTASRSDEKLLSVRFRTEYYIMGTPHPSREEWGVTLERESGKCLSLDDLVDTGDDFEHWLRAQNWVELNYWMPGGGTPEDIKYQLGLYLEHSPDPAEHIRDFYVTDSALVIIAWEYPRADTHLSVPLSDLKLKGDDLWNG